MLNQHPEFGAPHYACLYAWLLALRSEVLTGSLSWLPEFNRRCIRHDGFGFYAALSTLLLALLRLDASTSPH